MSDQDLGLPRDLSGLVQVGRSYPRAPIVEAILEFRVVPPPNPSVGKLVDLVGPDQGFNPPQVSTAIAHNVHLSDESVETTTDRRHVGYLFQRSDETGVLHVQEAVYTSSSTAKYQDWATFRTNALEQWPGYLQRLAPTSIERVSLRFVNRIDIPASTIEIKDYLRTTADVSPYLPQGLSGYFLQLQFPLPQARAQVTLTSTMVPPPTEGMSSLILDIDVVGMLEGDEMNPDTWENLLPVLDRLRYLKNYFFEACITDATRGLIQ